MALIGIDISSFQGDVNFDVLKTKKDFVMIKASEGTGYADPKFDRNKNESRRVGITRGFYHFARPDLNSAEAEADWFCTLLANEPQEGEILALDFEKDWNGDRVGWCKKFLDKVRTNLNGYKPLLYTNPNFLSKGDWKSIVEGDYGLWLAQWGVNSPKATIWPFIAMWQYTDKEKVEGIQGNVDGNIFFGDINTFKLYGYKNKILMDEKDKKIAELNTLNNQYKIFIKDMQNQIDNSNNEILILKTDRQNLSSQLAQCKVEDNNKGLSSFFNKLISIFKNKK